MSKVRKQRGLNKIVALVAVIATVLLVYFSNEYISEHASHRCSDHAHCPVCSVINQCENNIRTVGAGIMVAVVSFVAFAVIKDAIYNFDYESVQTTLVSQKVRLDS